MESDFCNDVKFYHIIKSVVRDYRQLGVQKFHAKVSRLSSPTSNSNQNIEIYCSLIVQNWPNFQALKLNTITLK